MVAHQPASSTVHFECCDDQRTTEEEWYGQSDDGIKKINFSEMKSVNFHIGRIIEIVTLIVYIPVRLEMMFWSSYYSGHFFCLFVFISNCKENSEEFIFSESLTILMNTRQCRGFSFPRIGLSRIMLGQGISVMLNLF